MYRVYAFFIIVVVMLFSIGCTGRRSNDQTDTFKKSEKEDIVQIIPKRPVRIELRRNSKGKYSWTLRGEDTEEIIRVDSRLRNYINSSSADNQNNR